MVDVETDLTLALSGSDIKLQAMEKAVLQGLWPVLWGWLHLSPGPWGGVTGPPTLPPSQCCQDPAAAACSECTRREEPEFSIPAKPAASACSGELDRNADAQAAPPDLLDRTY